MKELFSEILTMENVMGALLVAPDGKLLFESFPGPIAEKARKTDWKFLLPALEKGKEMELIFKNERIYARKCSAGFVLVLMGHFAPVSMIRLNMDALLPALEKQAGKGLFRFFRRK